jgi:Ca2+/Na+ antiporter
MRPLLKEVRSNPLLWLLIFVPVVFVASRLDPEAATLLFVLSVLAIVPLAALLSHATESVAAKTGDAAGGLLNATLGNLTELVIAIAALRAGQYMLVKASIAGAIVANTLFMLGASFLLGGLKHRVQEFNKAGARLQAGLLFLATVAMLVPSAIAGADSPDVTAIAQPLSVGLAVLLIAAYGLGLLFSLKTHREFFASAEHESAGEAPWPMGLALATLAGVTVLVALVSEIFVESVQGAALELGIRGLHRRGPRRRGRRNGVGVLRGAQEPPRLERRHRPGQRLPDCALCRAGAGAAQLRTRSDTDGPAVLAGRRRDDAHRHDDRDDADKWRTLGVVRRGAPADGVCRVRHDAVPAAAPFVVTRPRTGTEPAGC